VIRTTETQEIGEATHYDGNLVVRLRLPLLDENADPVDWMMPIAQVREAVRDYYVPELNALLDHLEIVEIMPTGTNRTPTEDNYMQATLTFDLFFRIRDDAFTEAEPEEPEEEP
jgi:hypothetical protein